MCSENKKLEFSTVEESQSPRQDDIDGIPLTHILDYLPTSADLVRPHCPIHLFWFLERLALVNQREKSAKR